jgi:hypothetical protein
MLQCRLRLAGYQPDETQEAVMEILARFNGRNGQITIAQERKTGARLYVEEGVKQSYVLPGGSAGLDYVRLMLRVRKRCSVGTLTVQATAGAILT